MSSRAKGLLLGALHVTLVLCLGAKLLIDRQRYPRVWAETIAYDPDSPIRGRYLAVRLQIVDEGIYSTPPAGPPTHNRWMEIRNAKLGVENGRLVAFPSNDWTGIQVARLTRGDETVVALEEPVDFYIPEHIPDPSRRSPGERLWVEVTVPPKGTPRPIRLGVKKNDVLTPLNID
ncbi:MAG TPA: hypothetical protein VKB40_05820 [Candidatus Acidoferrales bacterium]|nr:hypothetical protein [Candidatus Acidoferrales bacterium]